MTEIIKIQIHNKIYISRHLCTEAVDVRSRDMTPEVKKIFLTIVQNLRHEALEEKLRRIFTWY